MESLKQINELDIKINNLRLDLIRTIAEINRMVNTNNVKRRPEEYAELKNKYYLINQSILDMNAEKNELQNKQNTQRHEAA